MIVFPNAKINLGLNITSRRPDGYHDLDMVMMPVGWRDILEIVPAKDSATTLSVSGRSVGCPMEKNLVYRAWQKLNDAVDGNLPPVDIYLHKIIPDGAGLGGGSADAAFTLSALDSLFALAQTAPSSSTTGPCTAPEQALTCAQSTSTSGRPPTYS